MSDRALIGCLSFAAVLVAILIYAIISGTQTSPFN
jgi:hypothetical protein